MKGFKITFFTIFMIICLMQTIRHAYVRCNYDRPSVLDKYDNDHVDRFIKSSLSLESLLIKFDSANNAIKKFEKGKTREEIDSLKQEDYKLYQLESDYREGIQNWEARENDIHELIVFWVVGLSLVTIGILLYKRKLKWLGLAMMIPGLIEMIWWSSPNFSSSGATLEFLKFLNLKLVFSSITLVVLTTLWFVNNNENDG